MENFSNEYRNLQIISDKFGYSNGIMSSSISYCYSIMEKYLAPGNILELGPAEGVMTTFLNNKFNSITVVEGSIKFCQSIKTRHPNIEVINSLFENFHPQKKFDNIILSHVLEHVSDPLSLLIRVKSWLSQNGVIFAAVPNANSIHRQAAVTMGLLKSESDLNDSDIIHGHRRVYSPDSFNQLFLSADLSIKKFGGYWLKPLSNKQIEESWDSTIIDAFMKLGEKYPEVAGEIYIVAC